MTGLIPASPIPDPLLHDPLQERAYSAFLGEKGGMEEEGEEHVEGRAASKDRQLGGKTGR
jgi:hypothetical protein